MQRENVPPPPITREQQGRDRGLPRDGELFHRFGLRPFGALDDLKLDRVTLRERPEPRRVNRRVVDEDISPTVLRDEPKAFLVVKPLDGTISHGMILLAWDERSLPPHRTEDHKKTATGLGLAVAVP
jgi:hypothetical protein